MQLFDIVSQALSEIKIGKKLLSLGLITTTVMIAVSIILYNMSASVLPAFYARYDQEYPDGMTVSLVNAEYDDLDKIKKTGLADIDIYTTMSNYVNQFKAFASPSAKAIENCSISLVWCNSSENPEKGYSYPANFHMKYSSNVSNDAWISCTESQQAMFSPGNKITIRDTEGNEAGVFTIKECNVQADDSSETGSVIYVPFATVYSEMQKDGISLTHQITGIVKPLSAYPAIQESLRKDGIKAESDLDLNIGSLSSMQSFFTVMALVMTLAGVVSLISICGMFLKTRVNFIIIQKILGNTNKKLIGVYFLIIEIMLLIAVLLAGITVLIANSYIYTVIYRVFGDFQYKNINTLMASLVAFASANIAVLISIHNIARKVGKTDVILSISSRD